GQIYATPVAVEPDDPANGYSPANVWIFTGTGAGHSAEMRRLHTWIYGSEGDEYEQMARLKFNATTTKWDVDSITNLHYLAGGISAGFNGTDWYAREEGNTMYLLSSGGPSVFRYDPASQRLIPTSILTPDVEKTRQIFKADPAGPSASWMCSSTGTQVR